MGLLTVIAHPSASQLPNGLLQSLLPFSLHLHSHPPRFHFTEILRGSSHKFRSLFCHIKSEDRSISKISLRGVHHTWSCTAALWGSGPQMTGCPTSFPTLSGPGHPVATSLSSALSHGSLNQTTHH